MPSTLPGGISGIAWHPKEAHRSHMAFAVPAGYAQAVAATPRPSHYCNAPDEVEDAVSWRSQSICIGRPPQEGGGGGGGPFWGWQGAAAGGHHVACQGGMQLLVAPATVATAPPCARACSVQLWCWQRRAFAQTHDTG